jgi:hypothetical protein
VEVPNEKVHQGEIKDMLVPSWPKIKWS